MSAFDLDFDFYWRQQDAQRHENLDQTNDEEEEDDFPDEAMRINDRIAPQLEDEGVFDHEEQSSGGFDYEFIDKVLDSQECVVCGFPMRDAVQTHCGHRFCYTCLTESLRKTGPNCPTCREAIAIGDFHGKHLIDCPCVHVTCCKCKGEFQRQHLELHLSEQCPYRIVQCAYCKADMPYYIKPEHEDKSCTSPYKNMRFIMMLTEHVVQCEQQQNDVITPWFKYTADRLKEVLLSNHAQVSQYLTTLETLLFTSDLDTHILHIFDQFKSLRA